MGRVREGKLTKQAEETPEWAALCAAWRAAQAATPTGVAGLRLARSARTGECLASLLEEARRQDGDTQDAAGRFHPSPARKAL